MKKHSVQISSRINKEVSDKLEKIISETGVTKGEQVRIAINKYTELYEIIKSGKNISFIPNLEIDESIKVLNELEKITKEDNEIKISDKTKDVIGSLIVGIECGIIPKLKNKHSDKICNYTY